MVGVFVDHAGAPANVPSRLTAGQNQDLLEARSEDAWGQSSTRQKKRRMVGCRRAAMPFQGRSGRVH